MVGGAQVVQRQGVAVLAQRGAGLGVPEALLSLQQVTVGHQDRRYGVTQGVQAHPRMSVRIDEHPEPVAQQVGAQPSGVVAPGGEQPRPERRANLSLAPAPDAVGPQAFSAGSDGDPTAAAGLGRGHDLVGQSPTAAVEGPFVGWASHRTAGGECVAGDCRLLPGSRAIGVGRPVEGRAPRAAVMLYGYDGEGFPVAQTLLVLSAEADGLVLLAASDTFVGVSQEHALCETDVALEGDSVVQTFRDCLDPAAEADVVTWKRNGSRLSP